MIDKMSQDKRIKIPPDIYKLAIRTCEKAGDTEAMGVAQKLASRIENRGQSFSA